MIQCRSVYPLLALFALFCGLSPNTAIAAPESSPGTEVDASAMTGDPKATPALKETVSTSRGQVEIAGQKVDYTAVVGDLLLRDDDDKVKAKMTYVSYLRDSEDPRQRPVTFAFNGGPGSASIWVHLGAFGPKRALLDDEGFPLGPPPGRLVNNEFSLLDATDLVFIDPVETGWSRPAPGVETSEFSGYTKDVMHIGEFIRLWLSRNDRWLSPKFIAGESYGTTRAAGLAQYLQDAHGMYLNGIALISSVINWQSKVFHIGNDLPYALILPTYTASAWYHGQLPERLQGDLRAALDEAEAFALGEYSSAMMLGDRLPAERRTKVVQRLAELTGLSEQYIEETDLRVDIYRFAKELLRQRGLTVGRIDSRYTNSDRDDAGESFEFDPSMSVVTSHYVSLLKDYLRRELGYRSDTVFRASAGWKLRPWNYHPDNLTDGYNTNGYANYAETLRQAMHKNPHLKVLVMSGYYDLATPYFASDYTVDHMQLEPKLRGNIKVEYYESGHMMYVRKVDHAKFRDDYLQLIEDALGQ